MNCAVLMSGSGCLRDVSSAARQRCARDPLATAHIGGEPLDRLGATLELLRIRAVVQNGAFVFARGAHGQRRAPCVFIHHGHKYTTLEVICLPLPPNPFAVSPTTTLIPHLSPSPLTVTAAAPRAAQELPSLCWGQQEAVVRFGGNAEIGRKGGQELRVRDESLRWPLSRGGLRRVSGPFVTDRQTAPSMSPSM
ncbi:unnamed protein product [Lampetra fluviatilis]